MANFITNPSAATNIAGWDTNEISPSRVTSIPGLSFPPGVSTALASFGDRNLSTEIIELPSGADEGDTLQWTLYCAPSEAFPDPVIWVTFNWYLGSSSETSTVVIDGEDLTYEWEHLYGDVEIPAGVDGFQVDIYSSYSAEEYYYVTLVGVSFDGGSNLVLNPSAATDTNHWLDTTAYDLFLERVTSVPGLTFPDGVSSAFRSHTGGQFSSTPIEFPEVLEEGRLLDLSLYATVGAAGTAGEWAFYVYFYAGEVFTEYADLGVAEVGIDWAQYVFRAVVPADVDGFSVLVVSSVGDPPEYAYLTLVELTADTYPGTVSAIGVCSSSGTGTFRGTWHRSASAVGVCSSSGTGTFRGTWHRSASATGVLTSSVVRLACDWERDGSSQGVSDTHTFLAYNRPNIIGNPRAFRDNTYWKNESDYGVPATRVTSIAGVSFPEPAAAALTVHADHTNAVLSVGENSDGYGFKEFPLPVGTGPGDWLFIQCSVCIRGASAGHVELEIVAVFDQVSIEETSFWDPAGTFSGDFTEFTNCAIAYQLSEYLSPTTSIALRFSAQDPLYTYPDVFDLYVTNVLVEPGTEFGEIELYRESETPLVSRILPASPSSSQGVCAAGTFPLGKVNLIPNPSGMVNGELSKEFWLDVEALFPVDTIEELGFPSGITSAFMISGGWDFVFNSSIVSLSALLGYTTGSYLELSAWVSSGLVDETVCDMGIRFYYNGSFVSESVIETTLQTGWHQWSRDARIPAGVNGFAFYSYSATAGAQQYYTEVSVTRKTEIPLVTRILPAPPGSSQGVSRDYAIGARRYAMEVPRSASYDIYGYVLRSVDSSYDVSSSVYEVFASVSASWNVAGLAVSSTSSAYSIDRREEDVRTLCWLNDIDLNDGIHTFLRSGIKLPRVETQFDEVRSGLTGDIRQVDIRSPLTSVVLPLMIQGDTAKDLKDRILALTVEVISGGSLVFQSGVEVGGTAPDVQTFVVGVSPAPEIIEDRQYRHHDMAIFELTLVAMAP